MQVRRFIRDLEQRLAGDGVQDRAAMMAYYAVMSLFPMLVFVLAIALLVLPQDTVRQGLAMATETMPVSVRDLLGQHVESLLQASHAKLAVLGATLALWGASRGAVAMMAALNDTFHARETRSWLRRQLIALALTIGVAGLAVVSLSLLVIGPLVGRWIADRLGVAHAFDAVWAVGRWVGAACLVMVVWAIIYKFLPNTDAPFRVFTPGALTGVVLWLGASGLLGVYLAHFHSYETTYGALGGAIVFLTWLWISNMAILVGAEINDVVANLAKPPPLAPPPAHEQAEHEQREPAARPAAA
jgi:membrane protein